MFSFLPVNHFSKAKIDQLSKVVTALKTILSRKETQHYIIYLVQIENAAARSNWHEFKKAVLINELFGGAGALWEIWIEDKRLRNDFHEKFIEFMDIIISMGITDHRVKQIRKSYRKVFIISENDL